MTLRIASYNIRKCIGTDRRRDPGRVIDVLNTLEADVIALQEADKRLGNRPAALPPDLLARHSDYRVADVDGTFGIGAHGNAILVRRGIKIGAVAALNLPGFEPRGTVMAEFNLDGRPIRVAGVHLGLMRRHRQHQITYLCRDLAQRREMPTIIAGDFNEWSATKGLEALQDYAIHAPGRSFHAARPIAALDRIAVSQTMRVLDQGVVETRLSKRASDHLPIWADVELAA